MPGSRKRMRAKQIILCAMRWIICLQTTITPWTNTHTFSIIPHEPGLASSSVAFPTPHIPERAFPWNRSKLFISSLTQTHQVFLERYHLMLNTCMTLVESNAVWQCRMIAHYTGVVQGRLSVVASRKIYSLVLSQESQPQTSKFTES